MYRGKVYPAFFLVKISHLHLLLIDKNMSHNMQKFNMINAQLKSHFLHLLFYKLFLSTINC